MTGELPEQAPYPWHVGEGIGAHLEGSDAELAQLPGCERILTGQVEDDEIGMPCRYRFDVGYHAVAHGGNAERLGGVLAPDRAADHHVAGADGKQQLGGGRNQRDDALGRVSQAQRIAGIVHYES